jgi:hypothetical protein
MFRSYARFALLTHLGIALAAGAGVAMLMQRSRTGAVLAVVCLALAAFEYWPMPARARDVLPTEGHRWLAERARDQRTLDCAPRSLADIHVAWLMQRRLTFLNDVVTTCRDPYLGPKLAAFGYTHVVARESYGSLPPVGAMEAGLAMLAEFHDSRVYAVVAERPSVVALHAEGFHEFESHDRDLWQWMGPQGRWQVRNTTSQPRLAELVVELQSVAWPRTLEVSLDGALVEQVRVQIDNGAYRLGPWLLAPGDHPLAFRTVEPPFRPSEHSSSLDQRLLTVAFRRVRWIDQPSAPEPAAHRGLAGELASDLAPEKSYSASR